MPCQFPEHHTGSGPALGWLAALIIGAVVAAEWRAVLVTIAVCAALAVSGVIVAALYRSASSAPYDAAWDDAEPPRLAATAELLQARVSELERELAGRQAIPAPVTHQHLHLHGLDAADLRRFERDSNNSAEPAALAAIITRQRHEAGWPAIEGDSQ